MFVVLPEQWYVILIISKFPCLFGYKHRYFSVGVGSFTFVIIFIVQLNANISTAL